MVRPPAGALFLRRSSSLSSTSGAFRRAPGEVRRFTDRIRQEAAIEQRYKAAFWGVAPGVPFCVSQRSVSLLKTHCCRVFPHSPTSLVLLFSPCPGAVSCRAPNHDVPTRPLPAPEASMLRQTTLFAGRSNVRANFAVSSSTLPSALRFLVPHGCACPPSRHRLSVFCCPAFAAPVCFAARPRGGRGLTPVWLLDVNRKRL